MGVELTGPCGGCWHGYNLMEFIFKWLSYLGTALSMSMVFHGYCICDAALALAQQPLHVSPGAREWQCELYSTRFPPGCRAGR